VVSVVVGVIVDATVATGSVFELQAVIEVINITVDNITNNKLLHRFFT
jgi:hypothetical protein